MGIKTHHVGIFVSSLQTGGAEKVAITMSNEFARSGLRVDLIVMKSGGELEPLVSKEVRIFRLETNRGRSSLLSLLRYIRQNRPEAVLSFLTVPNSLLGLTKIVLRSRSPRLVGSERSYMTDVNIRGDRKILTYLCYKIATRIGYRMLDVNIALTEGICDRMVAQRLAKQSKIVVLPNPIDLKHISPRENATTKSIDKIELLAVGRLDDLKDYPTMFRAIQILNEKHDVSLAILGEGDKRQELEMLIDALKLSDNIKLYGNVANTSSWFSQADLLILSSKMEGFPNVIVEALAHGVPTVSTDCPTGPREILQGTKYGELVPVGDFRALANAVPTLLNRQLKSDFLRKRAEDFDSQKICKSYEKLIIGYRSVND